MVGNQDPDAIWREGSNSGGAALIPAGDNLIARPTMYGSTVCREPIWCTLHTWPRITVHIAGPVHTAHLVHAAHCTPCSRCTLHTVCTLHTAHVVDAAYWTPCAHSTPCAQCTPCAHCTHCATCTPDESTTVNSAQRLHSPCTPWPLLMHLASCLSLWLVKLFGFFTVLPLFCMYI